MDKLLEIPAWLVAISSLLTMYVVFTHDERNRLPLKIFAISLFMQFLVYAFFAFSDYPLDIKQFIARLNVILTNIVLSSILLVARRK